MDDCDLVHCEMCSDRVCRTPRHEHEHEPLEQAVWCPTQLGTFHAVDCHAAACDDASCVASSQGRAA